MVSQNIRTFHRIIIVKFVFTYDETKSGAGKTKVEQSFTS